MKNFAGYKAIKTGSGRTVYVREGSHELFARVLKEHSSNYHFTTILRTVNLLNADSQRGSGLNPAGDAKVIQSGNVHMRYHLHDGAVFIQTLTIAPQISPSKTGLYSVEYSSDEREWLPGKKPIENLNDSKQWTSDKSKASYIAISGRFDKITTASRRMPEHLIGAYKKANLLTKSGAGKEYSLFWSEKGAHKSEEAAQSLASVMQQSAANKLAINWLVHGDGIHTFSNAAKILKKSPLTKGMANPKIAKADKVKTQNVYFSNPASSTGEKALKTLCEEAGLNFLEINSNHRDLKRWSTLKNVGREMGKKLPGAVLTSGGGALSLNVAASSIGASSFGKAVDGVLSGISSSNYVAVGAGVIVAGMAVTSIIKKSQTLRAGAKCTFGNGNDFWYTDDKALLA